LGIREVQASEIKMNRRLIEKLVEENGTPILVIDHRRIRRNYLEFKERLPRVQVYYAAKANPEPEIIETLYGLGSSFDVASLSEFNLVFEVARADMPLQNEQDFVWRHIIYANPVKKVDSLRELNLYKPLLTYDSIEEMRKIREHSPDAGLLLRIKVDDKKSVVKFSNKFGIEPENAIGLMGQTLGEGVKVEGLSFHVGSQCNDPNQYIRALQNCSEIFREAEKREYQIGETFTRGYPVKLVDIGGGFPVRYNGSEHDFRDLANSLSRELDRLFPQEEFDILAEPGRFIVANAGTLVSGIMLAKHEGRKVPTYHIDDGIYQTFSGVIYDHQHPTFKSLKSGKRKRSFVFGPTCDGIDAIAGNNPYIESLTPAILPHLEAGDLIVVENMGAYTNASSTNFNGFGGAKLIHINQTTSKRLKN